MADVKISALPATAAAAVTDLLAKVDATGPTTQKVTVQQIVNLLQTLAMTFSVVEKFAAGKIQFNADGTAFFANSNLQIGDFGTVDAAAGNFTIDATGNTASNGVGAFAGTVEATGNSSGMIIADALGVRWKITIDQVGQLQTAPA